MAVYILVSIYYIYQYTVNLRVADRMCVPAPGTFAEMYCSKVAVFYDAFMCLIFNKCASDKCVLAHASRRRWRFVNAV